MNFIIWMHPRDIDPPHGLDLRSEHDRKKVKMLYDSFMKEGFNTDYPAIVGYPNNGRIQALSGTHRHMAAMEADCLLPVTLWLSSYVERGWGTEYWLNILKDIPTKQLMNWESGGDLWDILQQFEPVDIE